jgi:hypothetical protein
MSEPKTCKFCGKPLVRKVYPCRGKESIAKFNKRLFCDNECKFAWKRQEKDKYLNTRFCAICGTLLVRHKDEPMYSFLVRKTCSSECRKKLMSQKTHARWQNPKTAPITHNTHLVDDPWADGRLPNSIMFNPFI